MIRIAKVIMVAGLALFAFLVTFNNLTDYGSNFAFVQHVLSMDTTFEGNRAMYRAIATPGLWHFGYALIIAGEALACVLLAVGAAQMFAARHEDGLRFQDAKGLTVLGVTVGFLVWFVGFMVVGGEWFLMWQSQTWNGQEAAFRFYVTMLLVLIFVMQRDD